MSRLHSLNIDSSAGQRRRSGADYSGIAVLSLASTLLRPVLASVTMLDAGVLFGFCLSF